MDPRTRNVLSLVVVAVLVIGSWALFFPPAKKITQGLDLQGGLSVILTAVETSGTPVITPDAMDRAVAVVTSRVNFLGASEAAIQRQGQKSILVQLPGIKNQQQALKVIQNTGQLEFVDVNSITDTATVAAIEAYNQNSGNGARPKLVPGTYKPIMTGDVITHATVGADQNTGQIEVLVSFNGDGTKTWSDYTSSHIGKNVAIALDGVVYSAPQVQDAITTGDTRITGGFTADEAKQLATILSTGAIPVKLVISQSQAVGPTLGQDELRQGLLAAVIGFILVAIYMVIFYRGLGLITWAALFIFGSLYLGTLALLSLFGQFALSLPGIAGVVLTIGIAADSSILILERFKEEIRFGKTYRSAAKSGTRHAIITSADADIVTFVSAIVLFLVAIGPVKGFALTLMIGIVLDLTTAILFTRVAVIMLAENVIPSAPTFFGVDREAAAAEPRKKGAKGGVADV